MRRTYVGISICLLLAVCQIVVAQDATAESVPSTTIPATPSPSVSLEDAKTVMAAAQRTLEEAQSSITIASNLLNIFQLVGIGIGIIAFFGYRSTLDRFEKEKAEALAQVTQARDDLLRILSEEEIKLKNLMETRLDEGIDNMDKRSENISVALSLLPLGDQQYLVQDYPGALKTYEEAHKLDPYNPLTAYKYGYVHILMDDLEKAEQYLEWALKIDAHLLVAKAALGYVYRRQAERLNDDKIAQTLKFNQAERELLESLRANPRLVDADGQSWWGALGSLYRRMGNSAKAEEYYLRAVEVTPFSSYPRGNLAQIYMQQHEYQKMEHTYTIAERLASDRSRVEPNNYWWYTDLLYARLTLDRDQQLIEDVLLNIITTAPTESPYAAKGLPRTLNSLAEGLDTYKPERATAIRDIIKRLEAHFNAQNGSQPANG